MVFQPATQAVVYEHSMCTVRGELACSIRDGVLGCYVGGGVSACFV